MERLSFGVRQNLNLASVPTIGDLEEASHLIALIIGFFLCKIEIVVPHRVSYKYEINIK